ITDSKVEINDGEDVDGLEVVVTQHAASLSGGARDEHGEALTTYRALLFAADPARWTSGSRFIATSNADLSGRFGLFGLPAGRYLAVAVDDSIAPDSATDPAFLESVRSAAMEITLNEHESHDVTLPFVEP
ncbi:MAG TPA: hypothetical protein VMS40_07340, partial [Vicinamibacterales bacterium]|nr:hypothetical protein [Vicinamibacterales bacterium]